MSQTSVKACFVGNMFELLLFDGCSAVCKRKHSSQLTYNVARSFPSSVHLRLRLQKGPGRPRSNTGEVQGTQKVFDFAVLDERRQIGERKQVGACSVPKCFQDYVDFHSGKTGEVPSCQRYSLSCSVAKGVSSEIRERLEVSAFEV